MKIFALASRNLWRKKQRTIISAGAMGLAGTLMLFFSCLMSGFSASMVKSIIENETGQLQAHAPGWRLDPDLYNEIAETDADLKALRALGLNASPRLYGVGLAAFKDQSSGVELRGIDIAAERTVSMLHERLETGSWLDAEDAKGVVLGKGLARRLQAGPGDTLVILSQAADGSMANALYTVRGVLKSVGARADEAGLFMGEAAFRDFFVLPQGAHEIVIRSPRPQADLKALQAACIKALPGLEVLTWRQLNPSAANILDTQKVGIYIFMAIAYFAVGMVIFNAMLMNVFERIHEFGVMKALGVTPWLILRLVYAEALLEAALAGLMALALGLPLCLHYEERGLDLSGIGHGSHVAGMVLQPILFTRVDWASVWPPIAFLFVLAGVAVAYPAGKAALLKPVQAIYHR